MSNTLLSFRVMLENKRKEGTHVGDVKSKVMAEIYSCGIKPEIQSIILNDNVCTLIVIKDLGYTSVDKSLRTCEHFDTSIYLQDRQQHDKKGGEFGLSFPKVKIKIGKTLELQN